jgi:hypothetical protein
LIRPAVLAASLVVVGACAGSWRPARLDTVRQGASGCYVLADSAHQALAFPRIVVLDTMRLNTDWPGSLVGAGDRRLGSLTAELSRRREYIDVGPLWYAWKQRADTLLLIVQATTWAFFIRARVDTAGFAGALYLSDSAQREQREGPVVGRRVSCAAQASRAP